MESEAWNLVSKPPESKPRCLGKDDPMIRTEPMKLGAMLKPAEPGSAAYTRSIGPVLDQFSELKGGYINRYLLVWTKRFIGTSHDRVDPFFFPPYLHTRPKLSI